MKIKALVLAMMFFGALCVSTLIVPDTAEAKCIYCKRDNAYGDCGSAPSSSKDNPKRKHKHASNGQNCVWCGQKNNSQSCSISPTNKHQL